MAVAEDAHACADFLACLRPFCDSFASPVAPTAH